MVSITDRKNIGIVILFVVGFDFVRKKHNFIYKGDLVSKFALLIIFFLERHYDIRDV